ncbi:O-succinylbenzoate-CoA synthase [Mycolicibacterium sp. BiH015]|uniref:O-succinylbenzoate-CoA synthase n=1 Tax=Mycolicibacterium sp. BiH015 TaxID=3018808 RepID=UPI0022E1858E|nr:O-succinylbenzoate-CoA synthase [Mycolicibacterium sp. BiH015]MDA2890683.1 O-succinylbenzoate-CoA synthase [Mycolicibacterium sp. BiH015]
MRTLIEFDDAPVFAVPTADGTREGVLLDGPQAWGEFSPPAGADDAQAARWLTAAMEPSTVGWPDAVRGRVPVADAATRAVITVHDVEDAVAQVRAHESASEIVELLCRTPAEARSVRQRVDVPIAVDLPMLEADPGCADAAILRCGELGGVRRALRRFEKLGLPALVNFTGTTSVGLAADVALAAALPELPFACGPIPDWLSQSDIVSASRSLVPADGFLPAAPMPAAPSREGLARFRVADPARIDHWRAVVHRAAALI